MTYKRKNYNTTIKIQDGISQRVLKNKETKEIISYYDRYYLTKHGEKHIVKGTLEEAQKKLDEIEAKYSQGNQLTKADIYQKRRREKEMEEARKSIGKRFGNFTVIDVKRKFYVDRSSIFAIARCDCGTKKEVLLSALKIGSILSCGCKHKERAKDMLDKYVSTGTRVTNYKYKPRSSTGVKGVYLTPSGKYRVNIWLRGKKIHIGTFPTLDEAKKARKKAEIEYFEPEVEEFNQLMEEEGTPEFKVKIDFEN